MAETEEIGMEITSELARNREKIQSAHAKVHEFGGVTDSGIRNRIRNRIGYLYI